MPTSSAAIANEEEEEEEEEEELLVLARSIILPRLSFDDGAIATSPIPPPLPADACSVINDTSETTFSRRRGASIEGLEAL